MMAMAGQGWRVSSPWGWGCLRCVRLDVGLTVNVGGGLGALTVATTKATRPDVPHPDTRITPSSDAITAAASVATSAIT
jgi:hypothetical protein